MRDSEQEEAREERRASETPFDKLMLSDWRSQREFCNRSCWTTFTGWPVLPEDSYSFALVPHCSRIQGWVAFRAGT